jgi:hypothetical protein
MDPIIKGAIPVLPAADTTESLNWWIEICGFKETFRDTTPPNYAGISTPSLLVNHMPPRTTRKSYRLRASPDRTMVGILVATQLLVASETEGVVTTKT